MVWKRCIYAHGPEPLARSSAFISKSRINNLDNYQTIHFNEDLVVPLQVHCDSIDRQSSAGDDSWILPFVVCVSDRSLGEDKVLNRYHTEELAGVNKRRIEKLKTAWESWVTRLSEVELDGLEKAIGDLETMQKMRNWEEMVKHMGP
ncbi:hypothetical protein QFC20_007058 [Naganishia adeliensis]|uniref:Uncharacterized protein n=2 Tax=Naganishia adeliensis TaxID=92952 RepID=A0ACC2V4I1_9TREE|nr:hypothetical protein QFC20_007751 [Naganishia adeliensis]KAJ9093751.1 hypothetical protein QFC20_007058 [Naganishia adeliensis]